MFFEMVERVRILRKFIQNTANHDEKITPTAST